MMSIGTRMEVKAGKGGTVMKILGFGKDRIVVVLLKEAELWSPPWKVALASWFSAKHSAALYQASGSESNRHPVEIWVITFWISLWSLCLNLITMARPSA